jgi:hypothetical protein
MIDNNTTKKSSAGNTGALNGEQNSLGGVGAKRGNSQRVPGSTFHNQKKENNKYISEKEFQEKLKNRLLSKLFTLFRPELINRFDDIVFFHPLRKSDLECMVDIMLREPRQMLREKKIEFRLSSRAKRFLAQKGYNPAFGARPLRRAIQQYLEDPLSDFLIRKDFTNGDTIFIDVEIPSDRLSFRKDVPDSNERVDLDPFAVLERENSRRDQQHFQKEDISNISGYPNNRDTLSSKFSEDPPQPVISPLNEGKIHSQPSTIPPPSEAHKKGTFFSKIFHREDSDE